MSLAHKLDTSNRMMEGSAARPLPSIERDPRQDNRTSSRPALRKQPKKSWRRAIVGTVGWAAILGLCLLVVHRNTLVLAETGRITNIKEGLAQQERLLEERNAQVVAAQSVQKVDEWAAAKGMVRPTTVKSVAGDPSAVAVRPGQAKAQPAQTASAANQSKSNTASAAPSANAPAASTATKSGGILSVVQNILNVLGGGEKTAAAAPAH